MKAVSTSKLSVQNSLVEIVATKASQMQSRSPKSRTSILGKAPNSTIIVSSAFQSLVALNRKRDL